METTMCTLFHSNTAKHVITAVGLVRFIKGDVTRLGSLRKQSLLTISLSHAVFLPLCFSL